VRRILILVAVFACLAVSACDKAEVGDAALGASQAASSLPFPWAQAVAIALGVVGTALGGKAASYTERKWTRDDLAEWAKAAREAGYKIDGPV
jgi:hypothetical protein